MSTEQDKLDGVEKILKEPVFIGHDTTAKVVRAQLFFVSAISIAYMLMGLKISADSAILGFKFTNLNAGHIEAVLLVLLIYLIIHFVWLSWDALMEWRLRITGTRTAFVTTGTMADKNGDYPANPRQSTLYNFYVTEMQNKLIDLHDAIEGATKNLENNDKDAIKTRLDEVKGLIDSPRVSVSLHRFDNWFKYFLISQNLRWIFIEFLFPVGLAFWAVGLLWMS